MKKDIRDKPIISNIPYKALVKISKVREFGIAKYKDDNGWKEVAKQDFVEAAIRHLMKHSDSVRYGIGDVIDPESGLPHLDHAATSLILALSLEDEKEDKYNHRLEEEELIKWKNHKDTL